MKELVCLVMILCMMLSVTAYAEEGTLEANAVDTANWVTRDLAAYGLTMKVPEDMEEVETNETFLMENKDAAVFIIQDASYDACDTAEALTAALAESSGEQTETVARGALSMAHLVIADGTEYFVFFAPDHHAYMLMIMVNEDSGAASENALAVVQAIAGGVKGLAKQNGENAALLTPREIIGLEAEASPEWVVALAEKQNAPQLFVVAVYENTTAWISLHEKDADGAWKMTMSTPGFIGKNGLGKTKEGDGMSPVGVFSFNRAFGIAPDPGCAIPYVQVDENTYWSGDVREGMRYNELVSLTEYPDLNLPDSEHIVDYTYQYQYCLNISYNAEGTPGLGSAIFLHCMGDRKPYTGGCVAIPMEQMYFVMQHVSPDCVVMIDTLENLGGSF